jgi:hypothetical protein
VREARRAEARTNPVISTFVRDYLPPVRVYPWALKSSTLPRPARAEAKTPEDKPTCQAGESNRLSEAATSVRRKTEELFNEMHM